MPYCLIRSLLGVIVALGLVSAVAFSASYQLVARFANKVHAAKHLLAHMHVEHFPMHNQESTPGLPAPHACRRCGTHACKPACLGVR